MRSCLRSALIFGLLALGTTPAFASRADLARALSLYNQRQFDQAIEAATAARKTPETQDVAAVVLARAHLERYREGVDPTDLASAREALGSVRVESLDARVRVEYLMTLGLALFLEDEFGAAAQLFASAGPPSRALDDALAESLVDWYGSAVERMADLMAPESRKAEFEALALHMQRELAASPESAASAYWLAAALRGAGDAMGAWQAATAGWVRARITGARSPNLRADLDRLVLQGIIPDRVRPLGQADRDAAASQMRADWELVKERWR